MLALAATSAGAAEPRPLVSASAVWTADGKVALSIAYEGGACEETEAAEVETGDMTTDVVVIPTHAREGICTMNIVQVVHEETIAVQPWTERLSILVLGDTGAPKAAGYVDIEKDVATE